MTIVPTITTFTLQHVSPFLFHVVRIIFVYLHEPTEDSLHVLRCKLIRPFYAKRIHVANHILTTFQFF